MRSPNNLIVFFLKNQLCILFCLFREVDPMKESYKLMH